MFLIWTRGLLSDVVAVGGDLLLENKIWTIIHPAIVVGGCQSEMSARQLYCDAVDIGKYWSIAMVSIGQCGTICDCAESQNLLLSRVLEL